MLPLTERLKRPNLFTRAYGARKQVTTPIFTLYVLPRHEKTIKANPLPKRILPMVGFVVSKKICKSACGRNKIKRRLREAYRHFVGAALGRGEVHLSPESAVKQSLNKWYALVFVVKENALTATWSEICSTIENAFSEAGRRYG